MPVTEPTRVSEPYTPEFEAWLNKILLVKPKPDYLEMWLLPEGCDAGQVRQIANHRPCGYLSQRFEGHAVVIVDNRPIVYVPAEQAKNRIHEALSGRPLAQDVKVEVLHETPDEYLIHVDFTAPATLLHIPLLWRLIGPIPMRRRPFSFDFTGNKHCQADDGIIATGNFGMPEDGPPAFCIWTILHCHYLWNGHSFEAAIDRIKMIV